MVVNLSQLELCGYAPADRTRSYESSLSCSASSQDSILSHAFSDTSATTQSSCPDQDGILKEQWRASLSDTKAQALCHRPSQSAACGLPPISRNTLPLPSEQRQNPRRSSCSGMKKAPALVRQDERKVLFVNDLVDSATNMVEVIWPLSVSAACTAQTSNGRGVLPLRRYIEETLRRSRTSYSTLQVALYYLILIKPHVPKCDFTMEQPSDCPALRALQCGRRMFLAALILASKYLQDRNYSAKAWSKMSGLKVSEINGNERNFLQAVNWRLHIPDHIFKRWTDIVLRFTAPPGPPTPGQSIDLLDNKSRWSRIMPLLTPDLSTTAIPRCSMLDMSSSDTSSGLPSPTTPTPTRAALQGFLSSKESTPTPTSMPPRFLEPRADAILPTPPALVRMGPLPTPQMTPSSVASSTPAASTCSSRRPSMGMAMAQAQNNGFTRLTIDHFPCNTNLERFSDSRSSSLAPSFASSDSSPESMISDFSRSSRSSSISSVSTTSIGAPTRPACLARLATCQKVRLQRLNDATAKSFEGSETRPITILDDGDMVASPDFSSFSIRDDSATPVRPAAPTSAPSQETCRKRARARVYSTDGSDLQDTVRHLLREQSPDVMEVVPDSLAATASVSPCVLRRAMAALSRSSSSTNVKAVQPCSLRKGGSNKLPICNDTGRKRTCCSTQAKSQTDDVPELFMSIQPDTYMSV